MRWATERRYGGRWTCPRRAEPERGPGVAAVRHAVAAAVGRAAGVGGPPPPRTPGDRGRGAGPGGDRG
jgi:hypothetical protein